MAKHSKGTSRNNNLNNAKETKDDEYYTQIDDITRETKFYGPTYCDIYRGKKILCPCDESDHTNFYLHFKNKFESWGIEKVTCVGYEKTGKSTEIHVIERVDGKIKEYNKELTGNGDFRNPETIALMEQHDLIVTNPPFSLFREFVELIIEKGKHFLVIGNKNALTCKEIFPLFKENKMWLGYTIPKNFLLPDGSVAEKLNGLTRWFTNLPVTKREKKLDTGITYEKGMKMGLYQKFDDFDAINVKNVKQIPMDYDGVMGVPITFLDKYNPEQFELIGIDRYVEGGTGKRFHINGKEIYARLLIRWKR